MSIDVIVGYSVGVSVVAAAGSPQSTNTPLTHLGALADDLYKEVQVLGALLTNAGFPDLLHMAVGGGTRGRDAGAEGAMGWSWVGSKIRLGWDGVGWG